ncbi:hypothetical protein HC931_24805 [Candidatus Gracilibacteria bacterium]|nr:hypothetical protein [Candidatus Gracilibacteria bacterium]
MVRRLLSQGCLTQGFDAPAHGQTAGTQTNGFEIAQAIATVVNVVAPIDCAIAHSLGAASMTLALSEGITCRKVVFLAAVCWLSNSLTKFAKLNRLSPEIEVKLRFLMEEKFGKEVWERVSVDRRVANLHIPALLFHDTGDREVDFEESRAIAQAWHGAQLVATSGLGHKRILRNERVIQQAVDFINF